MLLSALSVSVVGMWYTACGVAAGRRGTATEKL